MEAVYVQISVQYGEFSFPKLHYKIKSITTEFSISGLQTDTTLVPDPVLGHILLIISKANGHRAKVERVRKNESNQDEQKTLDTISHVLFVEVQRFLSDRRPTTITGVAALLDFALSDVGQYVLPDMTADGRPFLPALIRVCVDTLEEQALAEFHLAPPL